MHVAPCSNCSTEPTGDFVIAEINMRATSRTDCRHRRAADLVRSLTFETLDDAAALPLPQIFKFLPDRGILRRVPLLLYAPFFKRLEAKISKMTAPQSACSIFRPPRLPLP